MFVLVNHIPKD